MVKLDDFIKEKVNNFRNFVKGEMEKTEIPILLYSLCISIYFFNVL